MSFIFADHATTDEIKNLKTFPLGEMVNYRLRAFIIVGRILETIANRETLHRFHIEDNSLQPVLGSIIGMIGPNITRIELTPRPDNKWMVTIYV